MTRKPLLPQQPVTARGDAPSRDLVEVLQRIVADLDAVAADLGDLDTSVTAIETSTSFVKLQAPIAASGQTAIDVGGIPPWVNRVTVTFAGFSTNGTSGVLVQIGHSGGVETTGYDAVNLSTGGGALAHGASTAGFLLAPQAATDTFSGHVTVSRFGGNLWVASGAVKRNGAAMGFVAGDKTLGGALDRVRITTVSGTATFDAGSVAVAWE